MSLRARRRDEALAPSHACLACVEALALNGAGLIVASGVGTMEPTYVTGPGVDGLTELQLTLGEGPGVEAVESGRPVVAGDLAAPEGARRWPVFAAEAVQRGMRSMYSVPLALGALRVGVLDLYRAEPGEPDTEELLDAVVYADTALLLVLDDRGGIATPPGIDDQRPALWNAEVHQAAGMVSVQLGVPVLDALVRLRAHAYRQDRPLTDVARAVVERRLRLPDNGKGFRPPDGAP
ncbi:GAF domain-containing protein [Amycolatopsis acidiphila]|nr:GAF domain-containing protein [Amycolatopsis acidiphila]